MPNELLKMESIKKSFPTPGEGESLSILKDINLTLHDGESIAITGSSGCGKSTLLSIAALLLKPTGGKIYYSGKEVTTFSDSVVASMRNRYMGFVFQNAMLLEDFTSLENVAMPLMIGGEKKKTALEKAAYYLSLVNMNERADYRPSLLSGGERQRVAIARALSSSPSVVFADEPTGNLDEKTSGIVENLLFDIVKKEGRGLLLVTHDNSFASRADRVYTLLGGVLNEK